MPNFSDMFTNVRLRLGEPMVQRPSDALVLQQIDSHTRNLLRQKQNSGNVWNFNEAVIQVVPNQTLYQINAADFGTPLVVTSYAPSIPTWVARNIPMYLPQDMAYDYGLPQNIGYNYYFPWDGSNCTAARCAFYWKENLPYIEFLPMPLLQCEYLVKYLASANGVSQMALTQDPLPAADCDLVEIRAAKSLLSNTEWMAGDTADGRAYNSEKRKELILTLTSDELLAKQQFDAANLITTGPRTHDRWNNVTI